MSDGRWIDRSIEVIDKAAGLPLAGFAGAILRDPKFPDPVVPHDLHLVKPAKVDADGNVNCLYCGRAVKWEAAQMIGSAGFECGTCQHANNWQQPVLETDLKRKSWPWIVAGVLAAGAVVGAWQYMAMKNREELAKTYPIVASDADEALIDKHVDRWDPDKLAAVLDNPPHFRSLAFGGACDKSIENAYEHHSDRDTREDIKRELRGLVTSAERGRFMNEMHHFATVSQVAGPVLSIRIHDSTAAKVITEESTQEAVYEPGTRAGTAYVFDIDGTLLCAGAFEAASSETIEYKKYVSAYAPDEQKNKYDESDRWSVNLALDSDLDKQVKAAIVANLKKVN